MQVVYMVKAMYLASLKLAGTLRVLKRETKWKRDKHKETFLFVLLKHSVNFALNDEYKTKEDTVSFWLQPFTRNC